MSIPRRGYIAAGLAVAVVGSLGVISTMNADADEVSGTPAAVAAAAAAAAVAANPGAPTPPPELPWGGKPTPLKKGRAGASSAELARTGADIAPDPAVGARGPQAEYGPKGYVSKKRTLRSGRTTVPPRPALTEPVPGESSKVNYHYAIGYQYVETDGSYANLVIGKPKLHANDYHSLSEIAVQSADGHQTVEVGWTVDRGVNEGSDDPHLFVYHWVDNTESCYNACGFVPYGSGKSVVGGRLPYGEQKRFGIVHHKGAWWIAYDSEWLGYFPDSLWKKTPFTRTGRVQWFGEVASALTPTPCSEMGTGAPATSTAAARIGTIALVNPPKKPGTDEDVEVSLSYLTESNGAKSGQYAVDPRSQWTFRFGGPVPKIPSEKPGEDPVIPPYCN